MGALMARLHQHGAAFQPPVGFTRQRMDRVLARGEEDTLSRDLDDGLFAPRERDILRAAVHRVDAAFGHLYGGPSELQVIHNDLHHENIMRYRGRLHPFDFEDTVWGYRVQDIAMALLDLAFAMRHEVYVEYAAAFGDGYARVAPWPEDDGLIDAFRVGRLLWRANWVARYQRQHLDSHIAWTVRQFEGYLATGELRLSR